MSEKCSVGEGRLIYKDTDEVERKTQQSKNPNNIVSNGIDAYSNTNNGKPYGGKTEQNAENLHRPQPKMTEDEVADNAIVFLLAGYETTSTMLSYTTYLLAKHQDVQQRLYEEIVQHLNEEVRL